MMWPLAVFCAADEVFSSATGCRHGQRKCHRRLSTLDHADGEMIAVGGAVRTARTSVNQHKLAHHDQVSPPQAGAGTRGLAGVAGLVGSDDTPRMSRTALVLCQVAALCRTPSVRHFCGRVFGAQARGREAAEGFKLTLLQVGRRRTSNGSIAQEVGELPGSRPPTTAVMPSPDTRPGRPARLSWASSVSAALMSDRWVKACGKFPICSPLTAISSE